MEEKEQEKKKPVKNALDLQKLKLDKLFRNIEKPVHVPVAANARTFSAPPEFVRNVMGSSAGAGSGEFHVYRHIRRRENARQKFIAEEAVKDDKDVAYMKKLEENRRSTEERMAKKRAKRQKQKARQRGKEKRQKVAPLSEQSDRKDTDTEEDSESEDVSDQVATVAESGSGEVDNAPGLESGQADGEAESGQVKCC